MLKIEDLFVSYGHIMAVKGVNMEINEGEIVCLIGANGAGKTTIMQSISGLVPVRKGRIFFEGKNIAKEKSHKICSLGIAQVPEGRRIFSHLTVEDNLDLGAFTRKDSSQEIEKDKERFFAQFPRMKERQKQIAGTLSGGEQQMLAMGRAILSRPKLLILDEPSMGLSPLFVKEIFETIKRLNETGTTILLVEQNARTALKIADRCYVLETGKIFLSGKSSELLNDPKIKEAYLGA